jgi:hypothetical protein
MKHIPYFVYHRMQEQFVGHLMTITSGVLGSS